jgi:hypothetical protein
MSSSEWSNFFKNHWKGRVAFATSPKEARLLPCLRNGTLVFLGTRKEFEDLDLNRDTKNLIREMMYTMGAYIQYGEPIGS